MKTGKREAKVEQIDKSHLVVSVKARAEKGKANKEVIAALAEYFGITKPNIKILSGHASRDKTIQII